MVSTLVIGCTSAPSASAPVSIAADEYPRMFQAAIDVMRDEGFIVDRQDYRFGRITSKPLTAPTIMEPWRRSANTAKQAIDSTINDQRRVVVVMLEPVDKSNPASLGADVSTLEQAVQSEALAGQGDYDVRVEVIIEQIQTPTRFLTGSTRGNSIYGHLRSVPAELDERGIGEVYWIPVGRDPYLEERLLRQIVRRSVSVELTGGGSDQADISQPDQTTQPPVGELVE